MKRYFYFALLLFFIAACSSEKEKDVSSQFTIKGKIEHLKAKQVYLEITSENTWMRIDTSQVGEGGTYELKYKVQEPGVFRIAWDNNYMICVVDSNRQVIELNADADTPYTSMEVKGSQATEQYANFNKLLLGYNAKGDTLSKALATAVEKKDKIGETLLKAQILQQRAAFNDFVKHYIDSIAPSFTTLLLLSSYVDINTDLDFYVKTNNRMQKEAAGSVSALKLNEFVSAALSKAFVPGHPAPDFVLYNPEGKEVKLSQFRGKLVLLDFWASWCGPCRRENPNVVKLYKNYKSKGLEILSVSLDRERDPWLEAIQADGLMWNHVWDSDGKASQLYHVESIPSTFLIDKDGKIIVQNLRGEALEQKVAELLK